MELTLTGYALLILAALTFLDLYLWARRRNQEKNK